MENTLLIISGTLVSLGAGVFFAFTVGICGALRLLNDVEYIKTMQSINRVIENLVFGATLVLPVILLPILTYMARDGDDTYFASLLAASILYIVGTMFLSVIGNVPLNTRLAKFDLSAASSTEIAATRAAIEKPWATWNAIRTVAATAATVLLFVAGTQ